MNQIRYVTAALMLAVTFPAHAQSAKDAENQAVNQYFAAAYQAVCQQAFTTHTIATQVSDAPQLELALNSKDALGLRFNTGNHNTAYQQLAVTEWDQKFIVAVNGDYEVSVQGADSPITHIDNLHCPERKLTMHHFNSHEWGSYVIEVLSTQSANVEMIVQPYLMD